MNNDSIGSVDIPAHGCPSCFKKLTAAIACGGSRPLPRMGDIGICNGCGTIFEVEADRQLIRIRTSTIESMRADDYDLAKRVSQAVIDSLQQKERSKKAH